MREKNRALRRSAALVAAAAAGALGVGLTAVPAAAHTPTWSVTCEQVDIKLTNYGNHTENTVTVTVDGKDLLPTETFANDFERVLELPDHDKEVTVRLVVVAQDGEQFSRDETKTAPVCEEPTPSPSKPTPTPSESSPAPSATPSATPSETPGTEAPTPAPSPSEPGLAETGSSSSTPLIAGAAAVVVAAGVGIMWASRRRRSTQG
ncbi:LAETG motif-containing sortase-dependent surface protein [Streptomyces sp. NPDC090026]|uniref:LAETG motif-containing sortase-dependent surface protein n=1 Tax=Streptomyces sp. NPDC090026 TaxID=3365923 RepID=UPI0038152AB0